MQEPLPAALADTAGSPTSGFGPLGCALFAMTRVAAITGSILFLVLVAMSIVSIVGRKLASAPVPGDVELLQMCSAFASALFFAYCHMNKGDVKVDFFTANLSPASVNTMDAAGSMLMGIVGAVLAWRTTIGAITVMQSGETSMILGVPQWIAQMLMVPGFLLLALAGFYMMAHYWRARSTSAKAGTT